MGKLTKTERDLLARATSTTGLRSRTTREEEKALDLHARGLLSPSPSEAKWWATNAGRKALQEQSQ